MTKEKETVAVIGAGIIGVNCALQLQAHGYNVTLIDKAGIGEGCSKGNAGHFATEQVFPLAEFNLLWQLPKLLLIRWVLSLFHQSTYLRFYLGSLSLLAICIQPSAIKTWKH